MTLSGKFGILRRKMKLDEMPPQQAQFAQMFYLAGAQASFQILAEASGLPPDEALKVWKELQDEIMNNVPPPDPLVTVPKPNLII